MSVSKSGGAVSSRRRGRSLVMITVTAAVLLVCLSSYCVQPALADDVFACCMGGWKRMRDMVFCDAPCCDGYVEAVARPPVVGPVVYCEEAAAPDKRRSLRLSRGRSVFR